MKSRKELGADRALAAEGGGGERRGEREVPDWIHVPPGWKDWFVFFSYANREGLAKGDSHNCQERIGQWNYCFEVIITTILIL